MGSFLDSLGVGQLPWVIRTYIMLFVFLGILMFVVFLLPDVEAELKAKFFTFAADGMKLVLGAAIGSLSIAVKREWEERKPD